MTYKSDLGIFYCIFIPISVIAQKIKIKLARILGGSISFCLKKKKKNLESQNANFLASKSIYNF